MARERSFDEHIARTESWLGGDFDRVPGELLAAKGIVVRPANVLSDSALRRALKELISELAAINFYFDHTDHLSDRQLYEKILDEVLPHPFIIGGGESVEFDCADVYDEETRQIFLAYYADDEERRWAAEDSDPHELPVPPRRARPFDRDRHLP